MAPPIATIMTHISRKPFALRRSPRSDIFAASPAIVSVSAPNIIAVGSPKYPMKFDVKAVMRPGMTPPSTATATLPILSR